MGSGDFLKGNFLFSLPEESLVDSVRRTHMRSVVHITLNGGILIVARLYLGDTMGRSILLLNDISFLMLANEWIAVIGSTSEGINTSRQS